MDMFAVVRLQVIPRLSVFFYTNFINNWPLFVCAGHAPGNHLNTDFNMRIHGGSPFSCVSCAPGMDSSNDVALYSGLGAGIIAVAILVVAVMLYRKNHSEYGVDVIDSSALAGGFQSFNFKTTRQGKRECHQLRTDTRRQPQGQKATSSKTSATGPPL